MRIEQLKYFSTLVKYNSITKASDALFITPQALSASIKALEQELNVALIMKSHTGVVLTEEGKKRLPTIDEILTLCNKLYAHDPNSVNRSICGQLDILTTPLINNLFVSEHIAEFHETYPFINLNISENNVSFFSNNLSNCSFDIAVIHQPSDKIADFFNRYQSSYIINVLREDKLAFICNKSHPLSHKRTISYHTARNYPFIILHNKNNLFDFNLKEDIEKFGFPQNYSTVPNINNITDYLIKNTSALALSFRGSLKYVSNFSETIRENLIAIPMRENISMTTMYIFSREKKLSPPQEIYINFLEKYFI